MLACLMDLLKCHSEDWGEAVDCMDVDYYDVVVDNNVVVGN